ncbi:hypothetical protein Saso_05140 [Streptomyces asoensis]|uniref:Uncharacterized protein n=1 Tax=Streptomyces asoensis TaxID=249586 RepID=A0ABQ3RSM3_9ACTN|nr:hypothetical protein GCM10010496_06070 [Streptomyces asoensis]GHI58864.1 hypothetical protein Saso_05140 [Streptomyces asoensis]
MTLPSGYLRRAATSQVIQAESPKNLTCRSKSLCLPLPSQPQWQRGVFLHRQLRQELTVLKDEAELLTTKRTEVFIIENPEGASLKTNLTTRDGQHPGQAVKQRRLT